MRKDDQTYALFSSQRCGSFHWNCCPRNPPNREEKCEQLGFLGISWNKFKWRFWLSRSTNSIIGSKINFQPIIVPRDIWGFASRCGPDCWGSWTHGLCVPETPYFHLLRNRTSPQDVRCEIGRLHTTSHTDVYTHHLIHTPSHTHTISYTHHLIHTPSSHTVYTQHLKHTSTHTMSYTHHLIQSTHSVSYSLIQSHTVSYSRHTASHTVSYSLIQSTHSVSYSVHTASHTDARSEIGRLPKWDVHFEIVRWCLDIGILKSYVDVWTSAPLAPTGIHTSPCRNILETQSCVEGWIRVPPICFAG